MNQILLWKSHPFLRVLIDVIIGIIGYLWIGRFHNFAWIAFTGLVISLFIFFRLSPVFRFKWQTLIGLFVHLILVFCSYTLVQTYVGNAQVNRFYMHKSTCYLLEIKSVNNASEKWQGYFAEVIGYVDSAENLKSSQGKCLLQLHLQPKMPSVGSLVYLYDTFSTIKPNTTVSTFDYPKYLKTQKNIRHQFFAKTGYWFESKSNRQNGIEQLATSLKGTMLSHFETKVHDAKHRGMLQALFLGDRSELNPEIKQSFSETGTIHVLAISGLHLGIIYLLIQMFLSRLKQHKAGRILSTFLTIALLWFFALMTGFSPSVCRSASMFSLFSIGETLERRRISVNTWSATCVFLLLANPLNLLDVGFQFSFLAVLGILVWFQPMRRRLISSSWLLSKIIDLLLISFCAQLAILPLSIYYFHQFPVYFLFANLLVVPCITVVMYATLMAMISSFIPFVSNIFTFIADAYLYFVLQVSHIFQKIPFNLIDHWYISPLKCVIWYGLIIFLLSYFISRKVLFFRLSLACVFLIFLANIQRDSMQNEQQIFCIVKNNGNLIPVSVTGKSCTLFTNKALDSTSWQNFAIPWLKMNGVDSSEIQAFNSGFVLKIGKSKILVKDNWKDLDTLISEQNPDVLCIKSTILVLSAKKNQIQKEVRLPYSIEVDSFSKFEYDKPF